MWAIVAVIGTIIVIGCVLRVTVMVRRGNDHGPVVLRGYGTTVHMDGTVFAEGNGSLGHVTELRATTTRGTVSPSITGLASSIASGFGHVHHTHFQVAIETRSQVRVKDKNGVMSSGTRTLYVHEGDKGVTAQSRSRTLGDETRDLMKKRLDFCQTFNSLRPEGQRGQ